MCVCEYTYVCEINIGVLYASILNHLGMQTCMYIATEPYTGHKLGKFYSLWYWFQLYIPLSLKENSYIKDIIVMFFKEKEHTLEEC